MVKNKNSSQQLLDRTSVKEPGKQTYMYTKRHADSIVQEESPKQWQG